MGLADRILWVDLATVVSELRGRGSRVPKLLEVTTNTAIFAQTNERNELLRDGLSYPVRLRNGKVNVHELFQALKRLGWPGAWV
jgi:hypothetical protein